MRLEFSVPFLESLNGKYQSFTGERSRKLQTHRIDVLRQVFAEAGGALDRAELEAALRHVFAEAADDAATGGSSGPAASYGWSAVAAAIWGVGQPGGDGSCGRVCH